MSCEEFQTTGYQIVRGLIDPKPLYNYLNMQRDQNKLFSDPMVEGSTACYKDIKCEELLVELLPKVEIITGYKLFKTYTYARIYTVGNILRSHKDRPSCEISVTLCLGYEDKPWPFSIFDKDEKPISILLEPGDALVYKGTEVTHWREKNIFGQCSQIFLHYVNQNGPLAFLKDDNFPKPKRFQCNFNFGKRNVDLNISLQKTI